MNHSPPSLLASTGPEPSSASAGCHHYQESTSPSAPQQIAPTAPTFYWLNPWYAPSMWKYLRREAIAMHPDDRDAAFRYFCARARALVSSPRFQTWRTDFRHCDEAHALTFMAGLDPTDTGTMSMLAEHCYG
jgi:hypothetical protein